MATKGDKSGLMRNLGAFVGHIVKAVKTDPARKSGERREVKRTVEEEQRPGMTLRRTTIEEIEYREEPDQPDHESRA